jgi:hypothetical protein
MAMFVKHALALARRGMYVFPCAVGGKAPACPRGCNEATLDAALIEHWWSKEPNANIGVATGAASHCFVLDVDGEDAEGELTKLEGEFGELPATVESITARGRHLFFEWPNRLVRNSAGKVAPGLDIRGQGGYVLAPPSLHPSGRTYAWSVDSARSLAHAPAWLLAKANGGDNGNGAGTATPPSEWRDLVRDGVSEGSRNASLARLTGHLLRRRVDVVVVLELLLGFNATRCKPPLPDDEVVQIVESICRRELRRRGGP